MSGAKWNDYEKSVITDNYPDGGWQAVQALLPHRPRSQIQSKASLMGVALKEHRGGTVKAGGAKPKDDADCKPYPWPPLDAATLALQDFAYITHKGQLRPMVRVELEDAA
jgi:hypothetical protein